MNSVKTLFKDVFIIAKEITYELFISNDLVVAFCMVALIMLLARFISRRINQERMESAIAIILGLIIAYIGGKYTGGSKGISDIEIFAGIGVLGGSMFRDFAIISTAYGADLEHLKDAGFVGAISLFFGIFSAFFVGVIIAYAFGYRTPVDLTTIGAGAVTFIVGPVTGTAIGASSDVMALSIAAGVIKSILTMVLTPLVADRIGLDNPKSAMVFGGLMGTTSGVTGGLAATDEKLVPYGAMTATFYTGLGSLLTPSIGYLIVNAIFG